jgi:hypothetical protein
MQSFLQTRADGVSFGAFSISFSLKESSELRIALPQYEHASSERKSNHRKKGSQKGGAKGTKESKCFRVKRLKEAQRKERVPSLRSVKEREEGKSRRECHEKSPAVVGW